jgi:hypothetical protein
MSIIDVLVAVIIDIVLMLRCDSVLASKGKSLKIRSHSSTLNLLFDKTAGIFAACRIFKSSFQKISQL